VEQHVAARRGEAIAVEVGTLLLRYIKNWLLAWKLGGWFIQKKKKRYRLNHGFSPELRRSVSKVVRNCTSGDQCPKSPCKYRELLAWRMAPLAKVPVSDCCKNSYGRRRIIIK
jgi:hypothetical protein